LEAFSPFVADRKLVQALEARSLLIPCVEDRILFRQGEDAIGLFILRSGEASLVLRTELNEVAICLVAPAGSLLGLPAIIGNEQYSLTATARRGSDVRFVTRENFEDLIRANPSWSLLLLQVLAAEVRSARRALAED
jgi:CRP-like cAMP-binding protein